MYRLGNSFEKSSNIKFRAIRPVGAELVHRDKETGGGQADMKELLVTFRNFANATKNDIFLY